MTISGTKSVKKGQKMTEKSTNLGYNAFSKFFFGKSVINQICGFFCHFLALFDTFSARYSHAGIKFEFAEQFQSIKDFI